MIAKADMGRSALARRAFAWVRRRRERTAHFWLFSLLIILSSSGLSFKTFAQQPAASPERPASRSYQCRRCLIIVRSKAAAGIARCVD